MTSLYPAGVHEPELQEYRLEEPELLFSCCTISALAVPGKLSSSAYHPLLVAVNDRLDVVEFLRLVRCGDRSDERRTPIMCRARGQDQRQDSNIRGLAGSGPRDEFPDVIPTKWFAGVVLLGSTSVTSFINASNS